MSARQNVRPAGTPLTEWRTAINKLFGNRFAVRIMRQSGLLFAGFTTAQAASFARNAVIGHWLSKGDFGIAATITLTLQLLEILSDLGVDRMIIQAKDGDDPALMSGAHGLLVVRGIIISLVLFALAGPMAHLFGVPQALWAFQMVAIVPLIKGFIHIDCRRMQRSLDNRPYLFVDVAPQIAAVLLIVPVLHLDPTFGAVAWIAIAQATLTTLTSHLVAKRSYAIAFVWPTIRRLIQFGWPIWLSAFPLVAVFQGDRVIVGAMFGVNELAGYTAAFMITMVPGLIAAKVGHALMLPMLSQARDDAQLFGVRLRLMVRATAVIGAAYLSVFVVAGAHILPLAFGDNYTGLGSLVACFALVWTIRMLQAAPGMALMSHGQTRPLLVAGLLRASVLAVAFALATSGFGTVAIASTGVLGELLSLAYLAGRLARIDTALARSFLATCAALIPVAILAFSGSALVLL